VPHRFRGAKLASLARMIRSNWRLVAAVVACAATFSNRARAAAPEPAPWQPGVSAEQPRPEGRELNGHVFTPVVNLIGPFATTSFGSFMLLGFGSTNGSLTLQLPGNPLPPPQTFRGSVDYAAVGGILSFEYAFLRDFQARIGLSETIYSGTTGASAAVVGSNARLGGNVGLTAGLPIGQSVRVAAVIDASYAPRLGLVLGPAIESAFAGCSAGTANCRFDFDQLFQQKNVFTFQPGVAASYAPSRAVGLTGNVSYVYNSTTATDLPTVSQGGVALGAAVDFDFMGVSRVPIGLQVNWSSLFVFSNNENTGIGYTDIGGGIFYTGHKELSLGIQVVDRRFRVSPDVDVSWNNVVAFIGLRYYWL
jgi:hypothetical protein